MGQLRKAWLLALGFWLSLSAICCLWCSATAADMCMRYAGMADAFARGDWQYAYHPRFGVLFMTFSGSIDWLTGLNGIHSCQVAAIGLLGAERVSPIHFACVTGGVTLLSASFGIAWSVLAERRART